MLSSSLLSSVVSDSSMRSKSDKELVVRVVPQLQWVVFLLTVWLKLSCCFSNLIAVFPRKTEAVEHKTQNTKSNSRSLNALLTSIFLFGIFIMCLKSNEIISDYCYRVTKWQLGYYLQSNIAYIKHKILYAFG